MGIVRDQHHIIIQHDYKDPLNPIGWDGGDSISRTGIMAMCHSPVDQFLLRSAFFKENGEVVRHPYDKDPRWRDYKETSRDQIVCAAAGYWFLAEKIRKRHWAFVNKDILMPDVKWHLASCAIHWSRFLWAIPGIPLLFLSVLWAAYVQPQHELNQLLCMCVKTSKWHLKLLCKLHPDWEKNVNEYWWTGHGTWRNQKEIADALIQKVEYECK